MDIKFELLKAEEIDCRVGTVKPPKGENPGGISLLLYKDARCDMIRLDKAVGPMNWQRTHARDNANCTVSIWDDEKKAWVGKEDTGIASRTDAEKGLASDSFKRACVNWGIGRELYTAPFIWISGNPDKLKWERYSVKQIGYDEDRNINALVITDKYNKVVFKMGEIEEVEPDTPDEDTFPKSNNTVPAVPPVNDVKSYIEKELATMQAAFGFADMKQTIKKFAEFRKSLIAGGVVPNTPKITTMEEAQRTFDAIYKTFTPSEGESA